MNQQCLSRYAAVAVLAVSSISCLGQVHVSNTNAACALSTFGPPPTLRKETKSLLPSH